MQRRAVWVWLAALVTCGVTARLGLWQLDRAREKQAIQQHFEQRAEWPVLDAESLARDEVHAREQWHRRVELQGHWIPAASIALENRVMAGQPGFLLLTPLRLPDGSAVLVQRGWAPRHPADRTRVEMPPLPEGAARLAGRVAPVPSKLLELGTAASGPLRQNIDLVEMARELRLELRPLSVLQLAGSDGLRRDWALPVADIGKHQGYAFQWFSLSALSLGLTLWFQVLRPRRRSAHVPPPT